MSVATIARSPPLIRVRGRSFIALVLVPEPPLADWLAALDAQIRRSPRFFAGRPVVVDLSAMPQRTPGLRELPEDLKSRGIRVIAAEGGGVFLPEELEHWPASLSGGRATGEMPLPDAPPDLPPDSPPDAPPSVPPDVPPDAAAAAPAEPPLPPSPNALLIAQPVRSGQSVSHMAGDVIVVGSVSSGAELLAGGSIHVYGTLRGRAMAGLAGDSRARIFCRRLEAELLAIDGLYQTADEMEQRLRGRAVQAWLEGDSLVMAALD